MPKVRLGTSHVPQGFYVPLAATPENPISGICPTLDLIWGKTLGLGYVRLV